MTEKNIAKSKQVLHSYKSELDDEITQYAKQLRQDTLRDYGDYSRIATDAFLEILLRGGKRVRGALLLHAYKMSGGTNSAVARKAAVAIEMLHAYILIIDDIQDRSATRRDGPTAHVLLENSHKNKELAGESSHFGVSIALNAALIGCHLALEMLNSLDIDPELKRQTISIANKTMVITAHGQTHDIMNEVVAEVTEEDVERVLDWKTARYTILNPIQIGMVLAAKQSDIQSVTEYATYAGRVFQITDDIIGTFGSEFESGKSPMDDTREGKRTVLTVYALNHSEDGNHNFILDKLGDDTISPAEFERYKHILIECGALNYAQKEAEKSAQLAIKACENLTDIWPKEGIDFLRDIVAQFLNRKV